ncbi:MAG: fibronectin type III domain-containing protein [Jatrophihabitans sp.]|uniref:fibronectin type III domain-containing protein n=1 Tax=Jatrophihabitans sp. TaxID=1932789 RepID=UPI003F7F14DA
MTQTQLQQPAGPGPLVRDEDAPGRDDVPPPVPRGLVAAPGSACVHLSWQPVAGATAYRVLRNGRGVALTTSPAHTDLRLLNGTTFTYAVAAVAGTAESAPSEPASATPAAHIPGAPGAIRAQARDRAAVLRWDDVRGASSYRVYRDGLLVAHTLATYYRDTDLVNGREYRYVVRAMRSGAESAESAPVVVAPVPASS